ncbi:hypothetical protein NT6N_35460 [Oceaniferula spumae]|uniref:Uncharacterized protein n=1 Tax=Oceaniferula spumae TaxID=2979115 RepID=A0AAT9FRJ6_9BACT
MQVPLDPIPTKPIAVAEQTPAEVEEMIRQLEASSEKTNVAQPVAPAKVVKSPVVTGKDQLNKAYPWLLAASVCLSGVLCWMYVTKPVMAPAAVATDMPSSTEDIAEPITAPADLAKSPASHSGDETAALVPSDDVLPGGPVNNGPNKPGTPDSGSPVSIDPQKLAAMTGDASEAGSGWESTNLKVQHILSADSGNGELEKIILDVPVRYQTRTMRWTPTDVEKARSVLARLMIYERDLHNLRIQGKSILSDWNELLEQTVPAEALRADSPSIPYNQGSEGGGLPGSSSVIKVDKSDASEQAEK